ncbi:PREDICTED: uncharacterized protein LOC106297512 [Brassica oleracea var. oleracea]|uniref:uncharacterized protein LOC106297512 n=1 Tax=Brassica oleracea var. oleracea TaxID=109376 RepID=UPI0006A6D4E9|nr:PREDICTED: uncharacterized protein LOC106297512 [Brassica oleracea var. oleracea]
MILAPRGGRGIIEGILNKDDRWREKFFVFKINSASEGDFDFERIPREWSDDIDPFESAPMSPELRGLMETLCRGSTRWLSFTPDRIRAACALPPGKKEKVGMLDRPGESYEAGSLERARKVQRGRVLRPRSQAQSPGLLARPVSVAFPSGGARKAPDTSASSAGDRALLVIELLTTRSIRVSSISTSGKKEKVGMLDRPGESYEAGSLERARKVQRGRVLRPRSQAQSPGLLARPVSVAFPSGGAREAPDTSASSAGDRALLVIELLTTRSIRALRGLTPVSFLRACPKLFRGRLGMTARSLSLRTPEIPILENPDSLAAIWCKVRAEGCELPSLEHMRERDAYVRMAVANAKDMEASNDYAALMEGRLANFPSKEEIAGHLLTIQQLRGELNAAREAERQREVEIEELKKKLAAVEAEKVVVQSDLDSMKEKYRREFEGRDRKARKDLHLARVSLAKEYEGDFGCGQGEGGFELETELERLKDLEVLRDVDYGLASVSDPSLGRLDLPEISGDSVNQD